MKEMNTGPDEAKSGARMNSPTPAPRHVDPDPGDRRLSIIEAAAQAFMTNGFAATSIDDVARLMNCTKGLIYYHFKNKNVLFFSVHQRAMELNLAAIAPLARTARPPLDRLRDMVMAHALGVITRLPFQKVALQGLEMHLLGSTTPEERAILDQLQEMHADYIALFADAVKEGIEAGQLAEQDSRLATRLLLGTLNWVTLWYHPRKDETEATRNALCQEMARFVMRGLGAGD
jgi:AcrR family transcriptional regulator